MSGPNSNIYQIDLAEWKLPADQEMAPSYSGKGSFLPKSFCKSKSLEIVENALIQMIKATKLCCFVFETYSMFNRPKIYIFGGAACSS